MAKESRKPEHLQIICVLTALCENPPGDDPWTTDYRLRTLDYPFPHPGDIYSSILSGPKDRTVFRTRAGNPGLNQANGGADGCVGNRGGGSVVTIT